MKCSTLEQEIREPARLKEFYQFAFNYAKNPGQKCLGKSADVSEIRLVFLGMFDSQRESEIKINRVSCQNKLSVCIALVGLPGGSLKNTGHWLWVSRQLADHLVNFVSVRGPPALPRTKTGPGG